MRDSGSNGSNNWPPDGTATERLSMARGIVASAVERRARGESVPDQKLIDGHPDLMPELGRELMLRRIVRRAFVAARKAGPAGGGDEPIQPLSDDEIDRPIEAEPDGESGPGPGDRDRLPDLFGYELLDVIGTGGQAVVYRAVQESTGRRVAVKILAGGAFAPSNHRGRFDREAQVLAALEHPGIVSILDRGRTDGGGFYLAMPYVAGCDLDEYLDARAGEAPATLPDLLRLFVKIADAVGEAHRNGIIHRDLKPSNIRIDPRGDPHVLDFGLARLLDDAPAADVPVTAVTLTGQVLGSMPWFSPEQAAGTQMAVVDARSDVYALGVMLYGAVTGRLPYEPGKDWHETRERIAKAVPVPPSGVRGARYAPIPAAMDLVLMKALAKRPGDRYASAAELASDLENVLAGRRTAARRIPRRRRWGRVAVASALTTVCLAGGLAWRFGAKRPLETKKTAVSGGISLPSYLDTPIGRFVRLQAGHQWVIEPPDPQSGEPGNMREFRVSFPIYMSDRPISRRRFAALTKRPTPAPAVADQPIEAVSGEQAAEFCETAAKQTGLKFRLPTKAELVYAGYAGSRTPPTVRPGEANAWGIYGLNGTGAEWCSRSDNPPSSAPASQAAPSRFDLFSGLTADRAEQDRAPVSENEHHPFHVVLDYR